MKLKRYPVYMLEKMLELAVREHLVRVAYDPSTRDEADVNWLSILEAVAGTLPIQGFSLAMTVRKRFPESSSVGNVPDSIYRVVRWMSGDFDNVIYVGQRLEAGDSLYALNLSVPLGNVAQEAMTYRISEYKAHSLEALEKLRDAFQYGDPAYLDGAAIPSSWGDYDPDEGGHVAEISALRDPQFGSLEFVGKEKPCDPRR